MKYALLLLVLIATQARAQSQLDNLITNHMATEHISGLSAVLVRDNAIVWYGNYGLADRDANIPVTDSTIFMLASISKTITATALMQLVEDGTIGMNDPVNDHVPFSVVNPNHPDSVITVKAVAHPHIVDRGQLGHDALHRWRSHHSTGRFPFELPGR
jgi:CubicO group peptidase (beta-lactamase class C family)